MPNKVTVFAAKSWFSKGQFTCELVVALALCAETAVTPALCVTLIPCVFRLSQNFGKKTLQTHVERAKQKIERKKSKKHT